MLTLLNNVLRKTNKTNISEIWPNLEVYFHGGVNFNPYKKEFKNILPHYTKFYETYNASEGFFAIQDKSASVFAFAEADADVQTTAFDITEVEWLLFTGGAPEACRILCNPTDLFPYSIRKKATGDLVLTHFSMRRKQILFQPGTPAPGNAGLLGHAIGLTIPHT